MKPLNIFVYIEYFFLYAVPALFMLLVRSLFDLCKLPFVLVLGRKKESNVRGFQAIYLDERIRREKSNSSDLDVGVGPCGQSCEGCSGVK